MNLEYKEITKEELKTYEPLILPMIYEELTEQEEINTEYICIASVFDGEPAGVIIGEPEGSGDLNLLSIWTEPKFRRMGIASALFDKMMIVAVNLYDWEDMQYGDDITVKAMYCLVEPYRKALEEWLMANDFTDFCILKKEDGNDPEVCSATAEMHFYRT